MTSNEFDPGAIVKVFNDHGVQYIVIGAFAAIVHLAPIDATTDIDFVPSKSPENLARLSSALLQLKAEIRVDNEDHGFPFDPSPSFLSGMKMLNLVCAFGDFDLVFEPAGFDGYEALVETSVNIRVRENEMTVASLKDVIFSKEKAGRQKDLDVVVRLKHFLLQRDADKVNDV